MSYRNCDNLLPCPKDIPFGYSYNDKNQLISYKVKGELLRAEGGYYVRLHEDDVWWEILEYDSHGRKTYHANASGWWERYYYDLHNNKEYYENSYGCKIYI